MKGRGPENFSPEPPQMEAEQEELGIERVKNPEKAHLMASMENLAFEQSTAYEHYLENPDPHTVGESIEFSQWQALNISPADIRTIGEENAEATGKKYDIEKTIQEYEDTDSRFGLAKEHVKSVVGIIGNAAKFTFRWAPTHFGFKGPEGSNKVTELRQYFQDFDVEAHRFLTATEAIKNLDEGGRKKYTEKTLDEAAKEALEKAEGYKLPKNSRRTPKGKAVNQEPERPTSKTDSETLGEKGEQDEIITSTFDWLYEKYKKYSELPKEWKKNQPKFFSDLEKSGINLESLGDQIDTLTEWLDGLKTYGDRLIDLPEEDLQKEMDLNFITSVAKHFIRLGTRDGEKFGMDDLLDLGVSLYKTHRAASELEKRGGSPASQTTNEKMTTPEPPKNTEQKESRELTMEEATNFEELYSALSNAGEFKVGRKKHSAEELIGIIKTVEEHGGKDPFRTVLIPGVEGLREKVDELLEKPEKTQKKPTEELKLDFQNLADGELTAAAHEVAHTREPDEVTELEEQFIKSLPKKKQKETYKEEREPDEVTELEEQFMKAKNKKSVHKEKKETPAKEKKEKSLFEEVENFDQLYKVLEKSGNLQGTKEVFTPEMAKQTVDGVRLFGAKINTITRAGGLREIVSELLKTESLADKLTPKNIRAAVEANATNPERYSPIEVRILNQQTGRVEKNWMAMGVNKEGLTMVARQPKDGRGKPENKEFDLEQLKIWNSERNPDKLFERINIVKSYDELMEEIDLSGGIKGSQEFFDSTTLKEIIKDVWENNGDINQVTRSGGLRQKVGELLRERQKQFIQERVKRIKKKPSLFKRLFGRK